MLSITAKCLTRFPERYRSETSRDYGVQDNAKSRTTIRDWAFLEERLRCSDGVYQPDIECAVSDPNDWFETEHGSKLDNGLAPFPDGISVGLKLVCPREL